MEIPRDVVRRLVDRAPVGVLVTLSREGDPRPVPIVFVREGEELWSPIDGKPKRGGELARIRDLRGDPRVGVLVQGYHADWQRLWWIRLSGHARLENASGPRGAPALDALRAKYRQYSETSPSDASDTLIAIEIRSVRSWAASSAAWSSE